MANLAIALTVVILLQLVLTLYQVQNYQKFMASLVKKYQDTTDYQLVSEVVKSKLFSHVVTLIFDKNKMIVEAYYLNGMTIFSKFQPYNQLVGYRLDEDLLTIVESENQSTRGKAVRALVEKHK